MLCFMGITIKKDFFTYSTQKKCVICMTYLIGYISKRKIRGETEKKKRKNRCENNALLKEPNY